MQWDGEGTTEVGRRGDTGEVVARIDPRYFRPAEVETLLGDPSKAKEKLGWTPTTTLEELVAEMVATDVEEAKKEAHLKRKGFVGGDTGMTLINLNDRFAIFGARAWRAAISRALNRAAITSNSPPVDKTSTFSIYWRFSVGLLSISQLWLSSPQRRWVVFMPMPLPGGFSAG